MADTNNGTAYDVLVAMLTEWGLGSLAGAVLQFLQDGYSQEQVSVLVQDTPEYKERFSGNEKRKAAGLAVLSPRDYINTEAAYRQILSSSGMPMGFYDQPSDFSDWIGKDVAPQEISERVGFAVDAADRMDAGVKQAFQDWYGVGSGDIAAFFLDQQRAMPHIRKIAKATELAGAYARNGLTTSRDWAEQLGGFAGDRDVTQLASQVAEAARGGARLSAIYGGDDYDQNQAESEIFTQDASARRRRESLIGMEVSAFSGRSGVGESTLAKAKNY